MAKEIEHKYLVTNDSYKKDCTEIHNIFQGYLSKEKSRTIRVRLIDKNGYLTVKGANKGDTRSEFEYPIPYEDVIEMLQTLCKHPIIEKTRHIVYFEGNKWEIDIFHGLLEGLEVAEIEIPYSDYEYSLPSFVGKNVTGDPRYYNSNMSSPEKFRTDM